MAAKKTEQETGDELVHHQMPDGSWKEMTKAEAAALEKKEGRATAPESPPSQK